MWRHTLASGLRAQGLIGKGPAWFKREGATMKYGRKKGQGAKRFCGIRVMGHRHRVRVQGLANAYPNKNLRASAGGLLHPLTGNFHSNRVLRACIVLASHPNPCGTRACRRRGAGPGQMRDVEWTTAQSCSNASQQNGSSALRI